MVHQVLSHDDDGVTFFCGRALSRQCDIYLNWASVSAAPGKWCTRCLSQLPSALQRDVLSF
eukprot:6879963-Karenia_brevis.AAC.1